MHIYTSKKWHCNQNDYSMTQITADWESDFMLKSIQFPSRSVTNEDGRCSNLLPPGPLKKGTYRVHFDTTTYYASLNEYKPFYPFVEVSRQTLTIIVSN